MSLESWLTFCATDVVLCLTPGPAVLFVVSIAMARGTRAGLSASLGILAGNAFYFLLSATGVAAVIVASNQLFTILKWAGAFYLILLGLRMLLSRRREFATALPQAVPHSFLRGVIVQLANPKALVFFVALLPQFIDPARSVSFQIFMLGTTSVLIELAVLSAYVFLTVRARELAGARWALTLERVGGGFLIAAGARLALVRTG